MRGIVAATIILLQTLIGSAVAQPVSCVDPTQSYSWSYPADTLIAAISYYLDTEILAVFFKANDGSHFANEVPIGVAQQFQTLGYGVSPDAKWKGICHSYNQILEAQNHCPLLSQITKYLLSRPSC